MNWIKLKHIYSPDGSIEWARTHGANPVAEHITEGIFRIYFTCRNEQNQSYIAFADIDFNNNFSIEKVSETPVLTPGEPGIFDDSGVAMGCILQHQGKKRLYYLGWNLKVTVPWLNTIGMAEYNSETDSFIKFSRAPLLDRSEEDPFTISYPFIMYDEGRFRMWYGSNLKWGKSQDEMDHVIKYAESEDAIHWKRSNNIHVKLEHKNEYALSKPVVLKDGSGYHMWYSYRGCNEIISYRIGYAWSGDGYNWKRQDHLAGIDVSDNGWDSEMICYPYVFDFNGARYMLYNGNGYGKTGFGIAVLKN